MTLDLRDIVYILVYMSSVFGVYFSFRNRLISLEKEIANNRKIIFGERGVLNLVDEKTCRSNRDQVFISIRRGEAAAENTDRKLDNLNENLLAIMFHLKIKKLTHEEKT